MTKKMDHLFDYLNKKVYLFEKEAEKLFPETFNEAESIVDAMKYSFFAGGKRFRPCLAMSVCDALEYEESPIIPACVAIEMIHTYSLIHDDLPAMDNDDFRRGKPSNHRAFGEAMAILAGDALLTEAFNIASRLPDDERFLQGKLNFIKSLSFAAGIYGMIGGQVMDISENKPFNEDFLFRLHRSKTGAMIQVSALTPLLIYDEFTYYEEVKEYADNIGLLFQITDDILDVIGNRERLGKSAGKDLEQNKLTFVTLYGLDGAREKAKIILDKALESAEKLPNNEYLIEIAFFVFSRDH